MFKRFRTKYIKLDEAQELLEYCRKYKLVIFNEPEIPLKNYAYIEDSMSYVRVTTRKDEVACTFIFRKDNVEGREQYVSGLDAFIELGRHFKRATGYNIPRWGEDFGTAKAILTKRKDVEMKRIHNCYSYDVNSAYGKAMTMDMPDTREIKDGHREVKYGEIGFINIERETFKGFYQAEGQALQMVMAGEGYASYIFDAMPSPFVDFANRWYERKICATNRAEKTIAKEMMNYAVGYLGHENLNPFLRAAVVEYANRLIRSVFDENTIFCNTDSIISTVRRDDLPIGNEMGEFKLDHSGDFASKDFNYQWNLEVPTYRGIPKSWFPKGWDILKDDVPSNGNEWELDKINLLLYNYKGENND